MLELREVHPDDAAALRGRAIDRAVARRVRLSFEDPEQARPVVEERRERNEDHLRDYDVVDGDATVGWALWWHRGDQAEVIDLDLEEPERAAELVPALVAVARREGVRFVGAAAVPGETVTSALVAGDEFVPRATNMALPLDDDLPGSGPLELRPMTQEEFDAFLAGSTETYIAELAAAGMSEESARERGEQQMAELIPNGLDSPGQSFFLGWVRDEPVGTLWLSTERPMAFVYEVEVDEAQRRRGYGEGIMTAGARWCREQGHPALGLNVFAHNPGARALYDKLGYRVTADFRSIDLDDAG
jgi:GNAT superfamily N-acetyltransferase